MTRILHVVVAPAAVVMIATGFLGAASAGQGTVTGTIAGHVRLIGPAPANPVVRMGADPRCSQANRGRRPMQELVLRSADGGLANGFVHLDGAFPAAATASQPVVVDQTGCLFTPRVVGARVGQTLQVTNNDPTGHNLHSLSMKGNAFNTSQPVKGMTFKYQLKADEEMMRIKCDIHPWMLAYVGVARHPYFAVSGADGAFTIARVPPGRYTIKVWHEVYGILSRTVDVKAGATATVDFSYTGKEKPRAATMQELTVPAGASAIYLASAR